MSILDKFSLANRTIVVLGADGRIGRLAMATIRDLDGLAIGLDLPDCDITDLASLYRWNGKIHAEHGHLHGVINATVGNQDATVPAHAGFGHDIQIGLTGAINALEAFTLQPGSAHILIGSDLTYKAPNPDRYAPAFKPAAYSAVKAGLLGLTRYYAIHLASAGIRVNLLAPAHIESGQPKPDTPIGRTMQPSELAPAIAFLISDASSYMTGTSLIIDGGSTAW
jgi:NAD(P)-dependent dehydrogenase (short-subunit alcohol dehydrogenase family)